MAIWAGAQPDSEPSQPMRGGTLGASWLARWNVSSAFYIFKIVHLCLLLLLSSSLCLNERCRCSSLAQDLILDPSRAFLRCFLIVLGTLYLTFDLD